MSNLTELEHEIKDNKDNFPSVSDRANAGPYIYIDRFDVTWKKQPCFKADQSSCPSALSLLEALRDMAVNIRLTWEIVSPSPWLWSLSAPTGKGSVHYSALHEAMCMWAHASLGPSPAGPRSGIIPPYFMRLNGFAPRRVIFVFPELITRRTVMCPV